MRCYDRRMAIWHLLCYRRQDTAKHLAAEFNVCLRTIYYDVEYLSLCYPIESIRGRYRGGIRLPDWYTSNPNVYDPDEIELLVKMESMLQGKDLLVLAKIMRRYST